MKHVTVLLNETIDYLNIKDDGIYVDLTLGGAGHTKLLLSKLKTGHLYAFDQDMYAINLAKETFKDNENITVIHDNFANIRKRLNELGVFKVDGIIADLGMSSFQIDDISRGFTYLKDTSLDMRMNQNSMLTAKDIVNTYEKDDLAQIFFKYGDEENGFKIANEIIRRRPLETTFDLVNICDKINYKRKGHSAKKVFQALRIAVNDEIKTLEDMLEQTVDLLNEEGRLCIITFHSLEDRIVKHFMKKYSELNIPKNLPIIGELKTKFDLVTRKPVYPSEEEMLENSRSKSAKLRVAKKNRI
ncbi:16S rRNA (cytosine(1402)-N(4))-methyltransferase RsmH [Haploplasma modicum]|jgi:16S rRNA (cytosine1402-N4)-methyltransferase|uniref:16S rRNA (cytosine(1402)-N(4))-methyltransferase RsmH n=1 Tax=Haploplasma modicum TaxID=2150 RepID=UPI000479D45A|nr:16S rRNA (cytosine(1402)-N(4))-methyltransferase RsmH [Haploplasma modicum]